MGVFLPRYAPREVRKMFFDEYEMHLRCPDYLDVKVA